MTFCQGYGAFRKTSTADAVARSFLLTPDFAVGKSSFFRRFDEPHFCYAKTGFMNSCITAKKKRTRPVRGCPYGLLYGVRCAPAFFERCGRFAKNCVCSRLHSPQRLTRLCGCCDEPHFCYAKTGFMNPCITAKKNGHDPFGCVRFWLRYRDSNPDRQSQRLQCYLYTISQYRARISSLYIILHLENLSRGINVKFQ